MENSFKPIGAVAAPVIKELLMRSSMPSMETWRNIEERVDAMQKATDGEKHELR